ncbi:MAG: RES domain-containing protein [Hylemonella sp.]|uniref:RES domain-containing protein n=1 Tax=Hylemonella sp. TaxID=2066020 RepID=UPI00391AABF8
MDHKIGKPKFICFGCVKEQYLDQEIRTNGTARTCSYCRKKQACIPIDQLADRIEVAFAHHYVRTPDQPDFWEQVMQADESSDYEWSREGEPAVDAIQNAARLPTEAAQDVLEILDDRHGDFELQAMGEETEFSSTSRYARNDPDTDAWYQEWYQFEYSLRAEARFFNKIAADHLTKVFDSIDKLKVRHSTSPVVMVGPKCDLKFLFRARVFQSDAKLREAMAHPDRHLGPPPPRLATAGRMNARGISVFYGATTASAALAEVRPPVGSSVLTAKFKITRPLRLLDLTALEKVIDLGSIFDPPLKHRLERIAFLNFLGQRISRPIIPDDQDLDYLATQAIADFLATANDPQLDGIIFRSAQSEDGLNVVLFQHASRVQAISLPKGTVVKAHTGSHTEDGWDIDYRVFETVPVESPRDKQAPPPQVSDDAWSYQENLDHREPNLEVDLSSVEVHQVESIKVNSFSFAVNRSRHKAGRVKF